MELLLQLAESQFWGFGFGLAAIGAGLAAMGAASGIGRIGGSACESIARQPGAAEDIRGSMILTAALIEGVALFAVVVALLCWISLGKTVG